MIKSIKDRLECNRSDPRACQSASEQSCKRSMSMSMTVAGHVSLTYALGSLLLHLILANFGNRPDLTPFIGWLVPAFLIISLVLYMLGRICR